MDRGELCLQVRIDAAGRVWAALVAVQADELGVEGLVVGVDDGDGVLQHRDGLFGVAVIGEVAGDAPRHGLRGFRRV